jgi:hypothetical protein
MKYLKMLGLAAVAAMALMAFVGAGAASATVLCKVKETPCAAANEYPKGTVADGTLLGTSAKMTSTSGEIVETCTAGTVKGTLEVAGGPTATPRSGTGGATVTWSGCTHTMDTIKNGSIEIHHIAGTYNGTVIIKEVETTIDLGFLGSCIYTYGAGTDVGILTAGPQPRIDLNAVLTKSASSSFACPTTVGGQAEGILTEPHELPVYVMDE